MNSMLSCHEASLVLGVTYARVVQFCDAKQLKCVRRRWLGNRRRRMIPYAEVLRLRDERIRRGIVHVGRPTLLEQIQQKVSRHELPASLLSAIGAGEAEACRAAV